MLWQWPHVRSRVMVSLIVLSQQVDCHSTDAGTTVTASEVVGNSNAAATRSHMHAASMMLYA
jgi:hypothetical protein